MNSVYLNEIIEIKDNNNEGGISGWAIFLIIIIIIAFIGIGIFIFLLIRKKSIQSEINSSFGKKEKMIN